MVKDQIRVRMDQLGVDVIELARRVGISPQGVRHWLTGRSFPNKSKTQLLEEALSFRLDYSEGAAAQGPTVEASLQESDIQTFLSIQRLPPAVRVLFARLADAYVELAPAPGPVVAYEQQQPKVAPRPAVVARNPSIRATISSAITKGTQDDARPGGNKNHSTPRKGNGRGSARAA